MLCVPPFAERVQVELEVGAGDDRCDPRAMLLAAAPALEEVCAGRGDVRVNPGPETLGIAAAPAEGKVTHYTTGGYRCGTKRATSRRQESRSYRSQSRVAGATSSCFTYPRHGAFEVPLGISVGCNSGRQQQMVEEAGVQG